MKATDTLHCKFCGEALSIYGFRKHEDACKRHTDEQRAISKARRLKHANGRVLERDVEQSTDKRLRLCISVGLEQIKLLLPYIEIDKVEIA